MEFSLSRTDLPTPKEYEAADGKMKPTAGSFWWDVKTFDGQPRFPNLFKLMSGLLSIPASKLKIEEDSHRPTLKLGPNNDHCLDVHQVQKR